MRATIANIAVPVACLGLFLFGVWSWWRENR